MSESGTPAGKEQLRAEIEQTRAELGDTVEALAAKADVKARTKQAVADTTDRAKQALGAARAKAAEAADNAADATTTHVAELGDWYTEARHHPAQRRVLAGAVLAVAVAVIGGVIAVMVRRSRA